MNQHLFVAGSRPLCLRGLRSSSRPRRGLRLGWPGNSVGAWAALVLCCGTWAVPALGAEPFRLAVDDGYRGIWYANQPSGDEYAYKYSGGMATYPQQHVPIAVYAPQVKKTFFVYGGTNPRGDTLLHMVSYYDHERGEVPRPRILLDKHTTDAHDNPTLAIDRAGHLWVFSNSHGTSRPSYIHRSARPYDIDEFERVVETNFSYGQPWVLDEHGFIVLHTRYQRGRILHWMTSPDGRAWSEPRRLAAIAQGHYQISHCDGRRVATALNEHPNPGGLNARTNLYYLETADRGQTWTTAGGQPVEVPLTESGGPALVHDYRSLGLLVYLKDLGFDAAGRPVILYLTSRGYASGPTHGPHTWRLAHWLGDRWSLSEVTTSDHNYDFGSLYLDEPALWRIIAPTQPGPQSYNPGGQVVLWTSSDQGRTWRAEHTLTDDPQMNHTYVRRPLHAHPGFYALWANGHARQPSASSLFFTDQAGSAVWQLPGEMAGQFARPTKRW